MCGLFGHARLEHGERDRSRAALDVLRHRGPDQWGEWSNSQVYMGHRRLSILDLSEHGRQPMVSDDGRVIIAVNGEIYNFRALRGALETGSGARFRSESDSEVLLHGYRAWGISGVLDRLDGMYAFSIYDAETRRLFLARDRVGIKPLYYAMWRGGIVWASELKALEAVLANDGLEVDPTAVYDFLTYWYVPTPKTLYRKVFKLEPAHYLEFDVYTGAMSKSRYWALEPAVESITPDDAAEHLRALVSQSVREQLVSDVPVGFFLSGGMDSSVLVAEAAAAGADVRTYTIGFDVTAHDETPYAAVVAARFGTKHHARRLTLSAAADSFPSLRPWYDEPFADTSALPTFLVSRFARETVTVALSGEGGDEVFGGYSSYLTFERRLARRLANIPGLGAVASTVRRALLVPGVRKVGRRLEPFLLNDDVELFARVRSRMLARDKQEYADRLGIDPAYDPYWHFRAFYRTDLPVLTRLQYLDFHTLLPDDLLTKVDRASMAVGLEVRVPFLAKGVIDFAFSLPEHVRFLGGRLKGLLKYAYRDRLPAEILGRPKKGFSIPTRAWSEGLLGGGSSQETILRSLFPRELDAAMNRGRVAEPVVGLR